MFRISGKEKIGFKYKLYLYSKWFFRVVWIRKEIDGFKNYFILILKVVFFMFYGEEEGEGRGEGSGFFLIR